MALALLNSKGQVTTFIRDDAPPGWTPPEGFSVVDETELPSDWEANASSEYKAQAENLLPPTILSKLMIRRRLRDLGKETLFDALLSSDPQMKADWDDATEIRSDDPLFVAHREQARAVLQLTEEQMQALLLPESQAPQ